MLIRYGFDIQISVTQATPVISLLDIHDDRRRDIVRESPFVTAGSFRFPTIPTNSATAAGGSWLPKATSRCGSMA